MDTLTVDTSRRHFLKLTGLLAIGFSLPGQASSVLNKVEPVAAELELTPFILLTKEGKITIFNTSPDMGQGTWQSVPSLLAEELEVSLTDVEIRQTAGLAKHRMQFSGGSSSIRAQWEPLRKAGAAAREMLTQAAANTWKVPVSECYAKEGKIYHKPSNKSLSYGELVEQASKLEVPKEPKLKDPKDFKILGKVLPRPDVPSKTNGTALFGLDAKVPGMLYASIQRCPVIHGKVVSVDDAETKKIPGVKKVLRAERKMPHKTVETVAVLAENYWAALQGRKALKIQWDNTGYDKISTDNYYAKLRQAAKEPGNELKGKKGDVDKALATASKKLEAQYETPFAAHAMIEPENAIAWVQGDKVEIWAPNQSPDWLIGQASEYLKIPKDNVKVNTYFMGGSFGRKAYFDFIMEAINLSKQANAPVKVIWTREDDLTQGPYRPGMLDALRGGLDSNGKVIAFEHKVIGESIQGQTNKKDLSQTADDWMHEVISEEDSPYAIPNRREATKVISTDIPIVWWRSVYSSTNAFGHECFVDELAHAAKKDPLTFRQEMLHEAPRFVNVLKYLAEKAQYKLKPSPNQAMGIAIARSFGSIAAYAITVSKAGKGIKINKVVGVIDLGMTVNPDNVKAQTEGNVVMGLSAALKPGITFKDGQCEQTNYHQYSVLRINEVPPIEIHVMPSTEKPSGAGEPGLPPVAPALCNAIFNLTGKRIRKLPFDIDMI
ncbi:molybdopterin-dependent oxidoreductase [Cytophagaceae bacterium DM2B3-1]|uniref:Molybdopterin-dependent oxidoreductase n=1 Tax=Xanthocytophaga flava TaxID=3048013 RepID=A0ABT7CNN9_9BACT|nr:molybdopterin cofactor-binding domain-containing protein [Xanthocytophaga flavus]MDJ1495359.1 molybdopterin-dependent oxidoreductase [Xanthocytophaga flavus]